MMARHLFLKFARVDYVPLLMAHMIGRLLTRLLRRGMHAVGQGKRILVHRIGVFSAGKGSAFQAVQQADRRKLTHYVGF